LNDDAAPPTQGRLAVAEQAPGARALLVMSPSGVFTFALPKEGAMTIGRGAECEIRIDDGKASRRHAVLTLGARCTLEDLASLNGTRVGDRVLPAHEPIELGPGEMASIGTTVLILQGVAEHAPPIRVWSLAAFEEKVAAERARAETENGAFGLLRLQLEVEGSVGVESTSQDSGVALDVARAEALDRSFRECLRPHDVVGTTAPGLYEILLPGANADEGSGIGALLQSHLVERGIRHTLRVASFPRDGGSREALGQNALDLDEEEPPASRAAGSGAEDRLSPLVRKIAVGEINVLILGETGVGKEVLARTIHAQSPRRSCPLVCINCAALSEALLESELFGHEKGAFTGAIQTKAGLLESANGGTVFLDELGEMPLNLQAKLLRVLEQREVQRVGALRPRPIDVRFLAATNRDVTSDVNAGRIRQDLYYRLNGVTVVVPPLRERLDEIPELAREFVKQAAERARRRILPRIGPQVLGLLQRYAWPGNVRELRNMMERAVLLTNGDLITLESFPSEMMAGPVVAIRAVTAGERTVPFGATVATIPPPPGGAAPHSEEERTRIVQALDACHGNQTQAAKMLGISRRTLVTRLGEYALPRPRKRS
jgi:DNA-binding NtrC family response regulator